MISPADVCLYARPDVDEPPDRKLDVVMGVLLAAMLLGVIALVIRAGLPKGEKVGEVDLRAADASVTFEASAGDRVYFRTTLSMAPVPSKVAGFDAMRSSRLSIALVGPGGARESAECAAYADEAMTVSNVDSGMTISSAPIRCSFTIASSGRHVVQPKASWSPSVTLKSASLEVRRERKQ